MIAEDVVDRGALLDVAPGGRGPVRVDALDLRRFQLRVAMRAPRPSGAGWTGWWASLEAP